MNFLNYINELLSSLILRTYKTKFINSRTLCKSLQITNLHAKVVVTYNALHHDHDQVHLKEFHEL